MNWKEHKQQLLKDDGFNQEYNKLETEYKVAAGLIRLRLSHGFTQEQLAKALNTKQTSIARIESGAYLPSLSMIRKIADTLGADFEITFKPRHKVDRPITIADK